MLLRQIKYFVAIVDTDSYTEVAERCFISQSAISQQIAALEDELGVKLTRRDAVPRSLQRVYRRSSAGKKRKRASRTFAYDGYN